VLEEIEIAPELGPSSPKLSFATTAILTEIPLSVEVSSSTAFGISFSDPSTGLLHDPKSIEITANT